MNIFTNIIQEFEALGYTYLDSNRLFDYVMKKENRIFMFDFIDDNMYYLLFDNEYNVSLHKLNVYFCGTDSSYDEPRFGSDLESECDIIEKYCLNHLGNHFKRGEL